MKVRVTEQSVVIPRELLEGIEEVEIRSENGRILLIPSLERDPILELGTHPVICGTTDASEHHDTYLYS
jgi:virulence-associated protein VagC